MFPFVCNFNTDITLASSFSSTRFSLHHVSVRNETASYNATRFGNTHLRVRGLNQSWSSLQVGVFIGFSSFAASTAVLCPLRNLDVLWGCVVMATDTQIESYMYDFFWKFSVLNWLFFVFFLWNSLFSQGDEKQIKTSCKLKCPFCRHIKVICIFYILMSICCMYIW